MCRTADVLGVGNINKIKTKTLYSKTILVEETDMLADNPNT